MSEGVLLDTCALLWLMEGAEMDGAALELIESAAREAGVWVSPVAALEVGGLSAQGRLVLSAPVETWFNQIFELPGVGLAELTPGNFIESSVLPGDAPGDLADRLMLASARSRSLTLITRDAALLAYAGAGHVRALAC